MPHDMNGAELHVGDHVIVDFVVRDIRAGLGCDGGDGDYCNVMLETASGLPGNGLKATISAINTKQTRKLYDAQ